MYYVTLSKESNNEKKVTLWNVTELNGDRAGWSND